MIREIKGISPQEGFDEVYLPGELELRKKENRLKSGIPLNPNEKYD
jgi:LDH2 family malate/lactate/ureidoglycolate dehydrogenase